MKLVLWIFTFKSYEIEMKDRDLESGYRKDWHNVFRIVRADIGCIIACAPLLFLPALTLIKQTWNNKKIVKVCFTQCNGWNLFLFLSILHVIFSTYKIFDHSDKNKWRFKHVFLMCFILMVIMQTLKFWIPCQHSDNGEGKQTLMFQEGFSNQKCRTTRSWVPTDMLQM